MKQSCIFLNLIIRTTSVIESLRYWEDWECLRSLYRKFQAIILLDYVRACVCVFVCEWMKAAHLLHLI